MSAHPWVHFTAEPGIISAEKSSRNNPRRSGVIAGGRPPSNLATTIRMLIDFYGIDEWQPPQPESEPNARTPQQQALPRPSTTPPMWANDVTRTRRPRRNRNQPNRQGIA